MDITASPRAQGVWMLTGKPNGALTVVHIKPTSKPVEPNAKVPFPPISQDLGEQGPDLRLSRLHIEPDSKDRLWIAGQDETGVRIFLCENNTLKAQTGFEKLLGGSRVNDIAVGDDGKVYFATDGAGVIVFDGQKWQSHPINEHLPHLMGSDLKPVNYVLPLSDGRLCVCTGRYLLISQ